MTDLLDVDSLPHTIRSAVREALEVSRAAQIKAIRALRAGKHLPSTQLPENGPAARPKGRSQIDMAYDILAETASPLHVSEIISRIAARFDVRVEGGLHSCGRRHDPSAQNGEKIAGIHCMRDPMSPPFHVNLIYGLRFLQLTCVLPLCRKNVEASPRSVPVFFQEVPALAKPGRSAKDQERQALIKAKKQPRGMIQTVNSLKTLRQQIDEQGCKKVILVTPDGGFCNRTLFGSELDRTELICRARKDARLCFKATVEGRRFFDPRKFTPEEVRRDESVAWRIRLVIVAGTETIKIMNSFPSGFPAQSIS